MTPLRRRPPDPSLAAARDAFRRVTALVDSAQRALLGAVPTARDPGVPLDEALDEFMASLSRAHELMPAWRLPPTRSVWDRCANAIRQARESATRLRESKPSLGFEALNARLGEVISPLEEFADAADELRRLR